MQHRQRMNSVININVNNNSNIYKFINILYFIYQKRDQNLDDALANIINNIHINNNEQTNYDQTNFVPREWYENLWRDFNNLNRDYDDLNTRFRYGLNLWRIVLIFILIYFLINLIKIFFSFNY